MGGTTHRLLDCCLVGSYNAGRTEGSRWRDRVEGPERGNPLDERLMADLKEAMRQGDELRRSVLRMLRSALRNEEIAKQRPLTEQEAWHVVSRQAKMRREAAEEYRRAGREDLAEREEAELEVLLEYLPRQMSEEEIVPLARDAAMEVGATGQKDMGKVMKVLLARLEGRADPATVSKVVRQVLQEIGS